MSTSVNLLHPLLMLSGLTQIPTCYYLCCWRLLGI